MKTKRPFAKVMPVAEKIVERLLPYCQRIELAGSLRRQANEIGDVEIVASPTLPTNLFGEVDASLPTALDGYLNGLLDAGHIRHVERKRWGSKLKSFLFTTTTGAVHQVDLFLQPEPATWGVNLMVRTGSAEFSRKMVTQRSKGGWMPNDMFVKDARLWRGGEPLDTPEEPMVFEAMGKEWVEPHDRA